MRDYRRLLIALVFIATSSVAVAQSSAPENAPAPTQIPAEHTIAIPAGTVVTLELPQPLSSETSQRDQEVALRLAEPIVIDGVVVVAEGAVAGGVILDAGSATWDGRPGKLIIAGRYLMINDQRVPLQRAQLLASGDHETRINISGHPLLTIGDTYLVGDNIVLPAGTRFFGQLGVDDQREAESLPEGHGRVVFFRRERFAGSGRSYPLRSGSETIGPIRNASFRNYDAPEGTYEFATGNGEEGLRFEVEAGVTYYVEWLLAQGAVLRRPLLRPSSRDEFEEVRSSLTEATP